MVILELSEAEKHFLNRYVAEGKLPTFAKLLQEGQFIKTDIASQSFAKGKIKHLTPWTIWPSIYTGMAPKEHGMIGFGQDNTSLESQCLWNYLNRKGLTTGILGSLINAPIQRNQRCLFYLPNKLIGLKGFFLEILKAIQSFFPFTNQSNRSSIAMAIKLSGQSFYKTLKNSLLSITKENDVLSQAKLQINIFHTLYKIFRPDFATLHLDHIAKAQHLYWRAAEPENFQDKLGELDNYFFASLEARKAHDVFFKDIILNSFILVDNFLKEMLSYLDNNVLLAIITGLGQKKRDPVDEIHKPKVHFYNIKKLFTLLNVENCEILSQMNPEITLKFQNSAEASLSAFKLSGVKILGEYPLFQVEQIENQLFLKESLPSNIWFLGPQAWVENKSNELIFLLFDYVKLEEKHQYTAKNSRKGWILLYGNLGELPQISKTLDITEIFPLLLSYFDDNLIALDK